MTFRLVAGENRHVTPVGKFPHPRVTVPEKFKGVINTVTGCENELLIMVTVAGDGVPREKSGVGTFSVKGSVWFDIAPFKAPAAVIVRLYAPAAVFVGTDALTDALDGKLLTTLGVKLHVPPGGSPAVQASVTTPVKFALAVSCVVAALEMFPGPIVIEVGENAEAANDTTRSVSPPFLVTPPETADSVTL